MLGEENSNKIIFFACMSRSHSFSFFSNVLGGLFFSSLDLWVFSQFLDVVVVVVVIVCDIRTRNVTNVIYNIVSSSNPFNIQRRSRFEHISLDKIDGLCTLRILFAY